MPQLTERCDIWRMVGVYDQGKAMTAVYTNVPCLRVPISGFTQLAHALSASNSARAPSERFLTEAREATNMFLIPSWIYTLTDDEFHRGRRIDINGNAVPHRYIVSGVRDYEGLGMQDTLAVFCKNLR